MHRTQEITNLEKKQATPEPNQNNKKEKQRQHKHTSCLNEARRWKMDEALTPQLGLKRSHTFKAKRESAKGNAYHPWPLTIDNHVAENGCNRKY